MSDDALRQQLEASLGTAYSIERELGGGGMSRVFVADEARLRRKVVIKVLPELAQELNVERFEREIQLAASLQQANIVPVLSACDVGGLPYYLMPYVEGESLRTRLQSGPLPIDAVIAVAREVGKALAFAHAHGVIHRDIKPDNVLLSGGTAVVTDFGIARAISASRTEAFDGSGITPEAFDGSGITQVGTSIGTPAYMAPEQIAGDPALDHRADLYSVGCMLYELLAGRAPFADRAPQRTFAAHLSEAPVPVGERRRDCPPRLADLVTRLLAKDPGERPQDAQAMIAALDGVGSGVASSATPALTPRGTAVPREPGGTMARLALRARALMRSVRARAAVPSARTRQLDTAAAHGPLDGAPALDSVAVLAFRDPLCDGGSDYFTEGITDELITALAKVRGLRVASRSASLAAHPAGDDGRAIGKRLKVDAVVEGTVWRSAGRLRIGVRLTSITDGLVLWAQTYDRTPADVFVVQDLIAQEVARILRPHERPGQVVGRTSDVEAYKLYLKGRHHFGKRPRETLKALEYFEQAIARDPDFSLAHAGVADAYNTLGSWEAGVLPAADAAPKARAAAEVALAIDPGLAEAHTALAYASTHFLWRWDDAERGFRRAIALNEHYIEAHHWFSHLLMARGRTAESLTESEHALALDPVSVVMNFHLAWHYWLAREYDACIEQCHKTLELDPHDQWPPWFLGVAYGHKGMFGAAISEHRKALARSNGSPVMLGALGYTYVIAGENAAALEVLGQLEHLSTQRHVSAYEIGVIHAARGDADLAFRWLDRAFVERSAWLAYLNVEPRLDSLRADPRFASLQERVMYGPALVVRNGATSTAAPRPCH